MLRPSFALGVPVPMAADLALSARLLIARGSHGRWKASESVRAASAGGEFLVCWSARNAGTVRPAGGARRSAGHVIEPSMAPRRARAVDVAHDGRAGDLIEQPTFEREKARVSSFLSRDDQYNWMIEREERVVGSIWVDLRPSAVLDAPAVSCMIGDPAARGRGTARYALVAVVGSRAGGECVRQAG